MSSILNYQQLKRRRRELRNQPIPSEVLMWSVLRRRQLLGLKFRRQYSIGQYIVDFFCPYVHLAVEIDGETHTRSGEDVKDIFRQRWIEQQGITFIRFSSDEVMANLDGVLKNLEAAIQSIDEAGRSRYPHVSS